jgi:hypothetical protein
MEIETTGVNCNNICIHLPGYKKGFCRWAQNGNKYCVTCYYQIRTDDKKCPCCKQTYRVSIHYYKQQHRAAKVAY